MGVVNAVVKVIEVGYLVAQALKVVASDQVQRVRTKALRIIDKRTRGGRA